jgi:hypothetical protein
MNIIKGTPDIAEAIYASFGRGQKEDSRATNVVDGLFAIARSLDGVALALQRLVSDHSTAARGVRDGAERVASAIEAVADAPCPW